MKKQSQVMQGICYAVVFFFVSGVIMPVCHAQINISPVNGGETTSRSPVKKVTHATSDNESFFDFAIIWGTFEERVDYFPLFSLIVRNPYPWYNRTMYVIGYQPFENNWVFKKSCQVECGFLHIGIVGFHRLAVVAYGNIAAF